MSHSVVVPDTSVLLKWVLESADEKDRERALDPRASWLSGRCATVLPSLWFFEVGNNSYFRKTSNAGHVELLANWSSARL